MSLADIPLTNYTLERLKVGHTTRVARNLIESARVETWQEAALDALVVGLTSYVLADRLAEDQTVVFREHPTSWWQHTKAVHLPTFSRWVNRPPLTERERQVVTVKTYATFPEATFTYPKSFGQPRVVQVVERSVGTQSDERQAP